MAVPSINTVEGFGQKSFHWLYLHWASGTGHEVVTGDIGGVVRLYLHWASGTGEEVVTGDIGGVVGADVEWDWVEENITINVTFVAKLKYHTECQIWSNADVSFFNTLSLN